MGMYQKSLPSESKRGYMPLSLTSNNNHLQLEIQFPSREYHWGIKLFFSGGCIPRVDSQKKNELNIETISRIIMNWSDP